MIIIGSTALKTRIPKDIDYIGTQYEFELFCQLNNISDVKKHDIHYSFRLNNKWCEFEIAIPGNSAYDYLMLMNAEGIVDDIPLSNYNILFSIKKSHIHFPLNFYKHIQDYLYLKNIVIDDIYPDITKKRFIETQNRLGKLKTPKLKKSKDFFNQSSKYVKSYFIHDHIHDVMAHMEKPMYTYMQPDTSSAFCSKKLWNKFTDEQKDMCVLEEAYVIALERKFIPSYFDNKICDTNDSFKWALMRICTTLCSGFFRDWATNRYNVLLDIYNKEYHIKFLDSIDNGLISQSIDGVNYIELAN